MYQVLYRKWRPKTFKDVVGQEHVTTSLSGAVKSGRLSHAYLFTGSRGTGKTSCAKILAKAVNCEHPVDGNPCNECPTCRGIDDGSILDVIEIDAASNNGVDNIRDLREEANYTPTHAKYRVYIIDEVHMLSTGAFNALLKTLEEPPEHVKFILATTEVHKLPSTILSRCQRFDFKRIEPKDIAARLRFVAEQEKIPLTEEGAMLIARISDGAMRDALSLLDRCSAYEKEITEEVVSDAAGLAGREHLFQLTDAVSAGDSARALSLIDELYNNACNMERLVADLVSHFRNMMIARSVSNYPDLIVCQKSELEQIYTQAQNFSLGRILSAMDVLNDAAFRLKGGANRRATVEMAVLRLCSPQLDTDVSALVARISELERKIENGIVAPATKQAPRPTVPAAPAKTEAAPAAPIKAEATPAEQPAQAAPAASAEKPVTENTAAPDSAPQSAPAQSSDPAPEKAATAKPAAAQSNGDVVFDKWNEALERLARIDRPLLPHMADSRAIIRGEFLLIQTTNPLLGEFLKTGSHANCIARAVYDVTGKKYRLGIFNTPAPSQAAAPKKDPLENLLHRAENLGVQVVEQ